MVIDLSNLRSSVEVTVFRDGKVLVIENRRFGKICCPGGKVEKGETFEQAARRELLEETGCTAEKLEFVAGHTLTPTEKGSGGDAWYCAGFIANIGNQEPKATETEMIPFWTSKYNLMDGDLFPEWYQWWFGLLGELNKDDSFD